MKARVTAGLIATALLSACGSAPASERTGRSASDSQTLRVVVAFYPFEFVAKRVAGPAARVSNLTKPGAEPHDLELTPQQVGSLEKADLVVYERHFQPAVDDAVREHARKRSLDVAAIAPLHQGYTAIENGERNA